MTDDRIRKIAAALADRVAGKLSINQDCFNAIRDACDEAAREERERCAKVAIRWAEHYRSGDAVYPASGETAAVAVADEIRALS